MNLAYFRKSKFGLEETVRNIKEESQKRGFEFLGETDLPEEVGKVLHICQKDWLRDVVSADSNLIGLIPCSFVVLKSQDVVSVGVGSPAIMGNVSNNVTVSQIASEAEITLKDVIHKSAGVEELKPVHVRLYSTHSCPYCTMEKDWLDSKAVSHEVVYVDTDQKEAEAMVAKTGQMGVPVTEIQYEDSDPEFIVGFDKIKLESILGIKG